VKNHIEDMYNYLQWYKEVYGSELYIEGEPAQVNLFTKPENLVKPVKISKNKSQQKTLDSFNPELKEFYDQIHTCQKCALGKTRKHFVFGIGNPNANIMFIGEAPGKDEDEQGIPFVGRAGKLLDKMLAAIGLHRNDIFIANVLKCRPPQNRDPLPDEILQCEPYLKKQLELIQPKLLVALGRIAGQVLLKRTDSLSVLRQEILLYEKIPLIVTYHPAALLRNPQWKQNAWIDFKKIKKVL
jgi:uracil-DNA glycosylase family 4